MSGSMGLTLPEEVSVELQLAPAVHVTARMRDTVMRAFVQRGLKVGWIPMTGDRSMELGPERSAQPTLQAFLRTEREATSVAVVKAVRQEFDVSASRDS